MGAVAEIFLRKMRQLVRVGFAGLYSETFFLPRPQFFWFVSSGSGTIVPDKDERLIVGENFATAVVLWFLKGSIVWSVVLIGLILMPDPEGAGVWHVIT